MKIFRTRTGSVYILETQYYCDHEGHHTISGYKVVAFEKGAEQPKLNNHIDYWFVDEDEHLVMVRDHKVFYSTTTIVGQL